MDSGDDTYCYTAAFNTAPNQLRRLPGTGKTLDDTTMYASGSATVSWNKATNMYGVKMNGLNYPAGVYCTDDNVKTGQPGTNEGHSCNPMIAAHLHSGNSTTPAGPASVIFCMGPGLPTHAAVDDATHHNGEDPMFDLCTSSPWSWDLTDKSYNPDVVAATTAKPVPATTAGGAPTTTESFKTLMEDCHDSTKECLVYFNVHNAYSLAQTGGMGLASAQLVPTSC
jgi:hypothetical protein